MKKWFLWMLLWGFACCPKPGYGEHSPAIVDSSVWADAPFDLYPEFVESVLTTASQLTQPPANVREREVFNPPPQQTEGLVSGDLVMLVVWGFALLALGFWWRQRRWDLAGSLSETQPAVQEMVDYSAIAETGFHAVRQAVQAAQPPQADVKRARVGLERIRMLRREDVDPRQGLALGPNQFPAESLNRLEWEVARLLARRFKPAEVAEIMDVSQGYVYNIRVALRKKLALTEEEDLEMFLRTHLKTH